MSHSKRALFILSIAVILLAIGYLRLSIPSEETNSAAFNAEYFELYMLGYSAPIMASAFFVWVAVLIVYRPVRRPVRRIVTEKEEAHHQIPVFGNS